jgi:hypothetical protein
MVHYGTGGVRKKYLREIRNQAVKDFKKRRVDYENRARVQR